MKRISLSILIFITCSIYAISGNGTASAVMTASSFNGDTDKKIGIYRCLGTDLSFGKNKLYLRASDETTSFTGGYEYRQSEAYMGYLRTNATGTLRYGAKTKFAHFSGENAAENAAILGGINAGCFFGGLSLDGAISGTHLCQSGKDARVYQTELGIVYYSGIFSVSANGFFWERFHSEYRNKKPNYYVELSPGIYWKNAGFYGGFGMGDRYLLNIQGGSYIFTANEKVVSSVFAGVAAYPSGAPFSITVEIRKNALKDKDDNKYDGLSGSVIVNLGI